MSAFWVRFSSGPRAMCVEAKTEALARERAATVGVVRDIRTLPYPAEPRMSPHEQDAAGGECPPLCYSPDKCAGYTCCPKDYACSE